MNVWAPYAVMFAGGTLTSLFDVHSQYGVSVMARHKTACIIFAIAMGIAGVFFFWVILILGILNPHLSPLAASLVLFVGYRFLVQSKFVSLRLGDETKEIGLGWMYDGCMFFFFDYVKSRETVALESRFMSLPVEDLINLAKGHAASTGEGERVDQIVRFRDEQFKKNWLANFCAKAEATKGSENR